MTVIAWKDGVMASDSCVSDYDLVCSTSAQKIERLSSGALWGSAGDCDCRAVIALFDKVRDPSKFPSKVDIAGAKTEFVALLALPRGGVWHISCGPHNEAGWPEDGGEAAQIWSVTTSKGYYAIGSGGIAALCAMDAGATAEMAVGIACNRNVYCRRPIHVMTLFDKQHPSPWKGKKDGQSGRRNANANGPRSAHGRAKAGWALKQLARKARPTTLK